MADETSEQQAEAAKQLIAYEERLLKIQEIRAKFNRTNSDKTLEDLKKQKDAIEKLWKSGKLSQELYAKSLFRATQAQSAVQRAALDGSLGAMKKFGAQSSALMGGLVEKLGIDLGSAGPIGIAIWLAALTDAQRVLVNWSAQTATLFGPAGKKAGAEWEEQFRSAGFQTMEYWRFVTDEMRMSFAKTTHSMGLNIKGISGDEYAKTMDRLIATGSAFGISADTMAGKLFSLQDTFRKVTGETSNDLEKIIGLSVQLQVAPQRFLNLVTDLTQQFQLQNLSLKSVEQGFARYRKSAGLGAQATEQLTRSTFQALSTLSTSKIAGLLAISKGGGPGMDIAGDLLDFYRGEGEFKQMDRFDLLQKSFSKLKGNLPGGKMGELAGVKLAMTLSGVGDMETGVRLYELLNKTGTDVKSQKLTSDKVKELLQGQTSAQDQAINFIVNAMNAIIRLLTSIAIRAVGAGTKEAKEFMQYQKVSNLRNQALNEKMKGMDEQAKKTALRAEAENKVYQNMIGAQTNYVPQLKASATTFANVPAAKAAGGDPARLEKAVEKLTAAMENANSKEVVVKVEADRELKAVVKAAKKAEGTR